MWSKFVKAARFAALLAFVLSGGGATAAEVSPEKAVLIRELLELTESRKNSEAILNASMAQMESDLKQIMSGNLVQDPRLTPQERKQIRNVLESSQQFMVRRFRELYRTKADFPQLVEEISMTLYDRHFTPEEIRDMIQFYRTPTGRKTIRVMPQLYAESMKMSSDRLMPIAQQVLREVYQEIIDRAQQAQPQRRTPAKRPAPAKPRRRRASS